MSVIPFAIDRSLTLPADLTVEEWESVGEKLHGAEQWVQFAIGDWLNYGERQWGDTYERAARITGYTIQALRDIACVARKVSSRNDTLTFTHHKAVAALAPPEQERWLDKAEKERWSVRELREQSRLARSTVEPAEVINPPKPSIPTCRSCGRECRWCSALAKKGE